MANGLDLFIHVTIESSKFYFLPYSETRPKDTELDIFILTMKRQAEAELGQAQLNWNLSFVEAGA